MINQLARITLTALALAGFAGSAQAALIAETSGACVDFEDCLGATLYLSVDDNDDSTTWTVTLRINTDGYTGGRAGLNQIGFKAIQDWTSAEVISAPVGSMTNPAPYDSLVPWNPVTEASIHANSLCDPSPGGTDKVCAAGFVNIEAGGDYTWVFLIEGGTLIADTSEWHLGGQYADGRYRTPGQVMSTEGGGTPPVPEPTAAVLFGLGALLVTRSVRRR
jgi:hypothetical protein